MVSQPSDMTALASDAAALGRDLPRIGREIVDRWIFVLMAALLLATVLTGFIPDSINKVAAIEAGQRAPFPPVLHVHAVLMGSWLVLLAAQTGLVANDHRAVHQKLGLASIVLMPAMVVTGFVLVPVNFSLVWALDPSVVPGNVIGEAKALVSNIALMQIRIGFLFPIFVVWALLLRRKDPETHKRLMILATILPMPAAVDRIGWLPGTLPTSGASPDLYMLALASPLLLYDLIRQQRVPRAYVIWLLVGLPPTIVVHLLWGSPWWLATAPKLMGVESW